MFLSILLLFVFGLVFGSFLNVVIYRTTHGSSPFSGRSMCPNCKKTISWKHNVPLVSFFWLHGKCAYCKMKISWQYPLVELLSGLLFVWWYLVGRGIFLLVETPWVVVQPVYWLLTAMLLLVVLVADIKFGVIPDSVNAVLFLVGVLYRLGLSASGQMRFEDFYTSLLSGVILALFFYGLWTFTRGRGFGGGDVKLAPALGLILGWQRTVVMINLAFISGAIIAVLAVLSGLKKRKQTIPFGPFLVVSTAVSLVWGAQIWGWYLSLL